VILSYKYRLYPNRAQREMLDRTLDMHRWVYNAALEQRITAYKESGESVRYVQQWAYFRDLRHENPNTLGALNASSMQHTMRKLDKAFRAFFKRAKNGEKAGFPRFKSWKRFKSFEYTYGDGVKAFFDKRGRLMLRLQNIGNIKVKFHRDFPEGAVIKHVIIKKSLDKWYVIFQIETPDVEFEITTNNPVGIDVGLHHLLAFSNNTVIENPRWLRHSLRKLRVAQRSLARKKKGSNRRRKAAYRVAKIHEKIANQRRDFWHKVTRSIVNEFDFIAIEDLSLSFMTRNHHLALSAHDAGLGMFRQFLAYKAAEAGSWVTAENPAYSSQECSGCGEIVEKPLSQRWHSCTCGTELDRDVNAATVILKRGLETVFHPPGLGGQDVTYTVG